MMGVPLSRDAKLMLNCLYGRMGMRPNFQVTNVVTSERAKEIISAYDVSESSTIIMHIGN
jgi:hypothetical protein